MNRHIVWLFALLALVGFPAIAEAQQHRHSSLSEEQTLFTGVRAFDATRGTMSQPQEILVERGIIKKMGSVGESAGSMTRIDCSGKYALPGLFDCHTHLAMLTTQGEEKMKEALHGFVVRGVIHVRDVGGPIDVMHDMTRRISRGELSGPEVFYTGPMLERSPLFWKRRNKELPDFTVAIDSTEDVDRILLDLSQKDASCVKTFGKCDREVYRHLVNKAESLSLLVVHDPGPSNETPIDVAIDLGVKSIEHTNLLPVVLNDELKKEHDELVANDPGEERAFMAKVAGLGVTSISMDRLQQLIEKMKEKDVYLCPTRLAPKTILSKLPPEGASERVKGMRKMLIALDQLQAFFTRELAQGQVRLLVGQDGFDPEGTFLEMELLKECGVSESEIIKGATLYPAKWLGLENRLGTLAPGREANLLILEKNPLDEIKNIRSTYLVMQKGTVVFRKAP